MLTIQTKENLNAFLTKLATLCDNDASIHQAERARYIAEAYRILDAVYDALGQYPVGYLHAADTRILIDFRHPDNAVTDDHIRDACYEVSRDSGDVLSLDDIQDRAIDLALEYADQINPVPSVAP